LPSLGGIELSSYWACQGAYSFLWPLLR
jgi:hypothetical protein